MLITLIELNGSPFCSFGGLVETPSEITPDDMPRLYAKWYSEWEANNAIERVLRLALQRKPRFQGS